MNKDLIQAPNLSLQGDDCLIAQHSRRYLGNKFRLIGFIKEIVAEHCGELNALCDIFAGTGVVGAAFNSQEIKVISNDLLVSNYICLQSFLGTRRNLNSQILEKLNHLNGLTDVPKNYFSRHFGERYFSATNAAKIGAMRMEIDRIATNEEERNILICSLIYATDRVANTVGHYDAYRKRMDALQSVQMKLPLINASSNHNNEIYREDANDLIRRITCDVLYIDPPYNSRQYSDAYHVLENLAEWQEPEVFGIARKMDRTHIKSRYCLREAADALADLVDVADCRHILLSYNGTGESLNSRSNARITDDEIMKILSRKGKVKKFEKRYKAFTTGRGAGKDHTERVFYCRVRNTL